MADSVTDSTLNPGPAGEAARELLKEQAELAAQRAAQEAERKAAEAAAKQLKKLSDGEIKKMMKKGVDPHDLKPNSKYDLFKDKKGDICVKPKAGNGPGDPTGLNINDY